MEALSQVFKAGVPAFDDAHIGYRVGRFYPTWDADSIVGVASAVNALYLHPFYLPEPVAVATLGLHVATAGAAGTVAKVGLWAHDRATKRPVGAPVLVNNVGLSTAAAGFVSAAAAGTLAAGWYWAGTKTTGTPVLRSVTPSYAMTALLGAGTGALALNSLLSGLTIADTSTNNMPTLASGAAFSDATGSNVPILALGT